MTNKSVSHQFIWCDVETTGLDPQNDLILEIAVILAEDAPGGSCEPVDVFHAVVSAVITEPRDPRTTPIAVSYEPTGPWVQVSDYVRKMHETNGLFTACRQPGTKSIGAIDSDLCDWLRAHGLTNGGVLGGNSVHFDLRFIRHHMPKTSRLLIHRVADVTAMRMGWESATGRRLSTIMPDDHRALDDVIASIQTYQALRTEWT